MSLQMMLYLDDYAHSVKNYMIGILIVMLLIAWIRTRSLSYIVCATIFGIYLLFVIDKTFFPLQVGGVFADTMKAAPFTSGINLIPFNFSHLSDPGSIIRELGLNLVLLVPFGFGMSFVAPVRGKNTWWLAPAVGVSIEAIQLVISLILGYPYRVIDITDVIMNTLGFLVGYGIFRLFAWLYIAMTQRLHIEHAGLRQYIYTVAHRATDQGNGAGVSANVSRFTSGVD